VQNQIREEKSSRLHAIELAVQHKREPGQRMPIAKISSFAGPSDTLPGQARSNMRTVEEIMLIIQADEFVRCDRPVAESGYYREESTNARRAL
jgi:hypothetical protein